MLPSTQSAYHKFRSTKTAVTSIYNDLLLAADSGHVSAVCLMDLTVASDTINHDLLLLHLECQFGLRGVVLHWFQSYLLDRSFQVIYSNQASSTVYMVCSVPKGSVLGPCLVILYMAELTDAVWKHHVGINVYADDHQLSVECCRDDMELITRQYP